jgi:sporulation protein YlmC with PRC-barrel domain
MSILEETGAKTWDRSDMSLISSERVTGSAVYNHDGDKLGTIDDLVIDKLSGQIRFAVMSFGGFLGIGENYHQIPWDGLRYDNSQDGYLINLSREALEAAPTYDRDQIDSFDYAGEGRTIDDYYGKIDGFYSPEQQSRRNTSGVDLDRLNPSHNTSDRFAGTDRALDRDAFNSDHESAKVDSGYRSDAPLSMPRN